MSKSKKPRNIDWADVDNWYADKYGQTDEVDVLEPTNGKDEEINVSEDPRGVEGIDFDPPEKIPQIDKSKIVDLREGHIEETKKNFPDMFDEVKGQTVKEEPVQLSDLTRDKKPKFDELLQPQTTIQESTKESVPKYGTALDVIDEMVNRNLETPAIWKDIPPEIRARLEKKGYESGIHEKPATKTFDPAVQKVLDYVGAPIKSSVQGMEGGIDKIAQGIDLIDKAATITPGSGVAPAGGYGDIAGGTLAIINGLISFGFGAATPFVPVLAGFSIANKFAEDAGLTEEFETVMSPFSKTFEDQVEQEKQRLKREGKTPEEISKLLGMSLTEAKEGKSIIGSEAALLADLVYNLAIFHKFHKGYKRTKAIIDVKKNKDKYKKILFDPETPPQVQAMIEALFDKAGIKPDIPFKSPKTKKTELPQQAGEFEQGSVTPDGKVVYPGQKPKTPKDVKEKLTVEDVGLDKLTDLEPTGEPTVISADPRSRFIVNQLEKQVTPLLKKKKAIDEKIITDKLDDVIDQNEKDR